MFIMFRLLRSKGDNRFQSSVPQINNGLDDELQQRVQPERVAVNGVENAPGVVILPLDDAVKFIPSALLNGDMPLRLHQRQFQKLNTAVGTALG